MKPVNALLFLQTFLDDLRDRLPSCQAVLVTDADGVVLLKSVAAGAYQENSVDAMLAAMCVFSFFYILPSLTHPVRDRYANSTAQASKLQFGRNKAVVVWQKDRVLVHMNASPYFVR